MRSIVFFFAHTLGGLSRFLVLVELAEENAVSHLDNSLPIVKLYPKGQQGKLVVIRLVDIICNVGLVKSRNARTYSVVSHHIFKECLSSNAVGGINTGHLNIISKVSLLYE